MDTAAVSAEVKRCGMMRDATSWDPCGGTLVYEIQINGEWYEMCPDCTAWCRAVYSGVTGVRLA